MRMEAATKSTAGSSCPDRYSGNIPHPCDPCPHVITLPGPTSGPRAMLRRAQSAAPLTPVRRRHKRRLDGRSRKLSERSRPRAARRHAPRSSAENTGRRRQAQARSPRKGAPVVASEAAPERAPRCSPVWNTSWALGLRRGRAAFRQATTARTSARPMKTAAHRDPRGVPRTPKGSGTINECTVHFSRVGWSVRDKQTLRLPFQAEEKIAL